LNQVGVDNPVTN